MVYTNIEVCYLPHFPKVIPSEKTIIRMTATCNRIPLFDESLLGYLADICQTHTVQIELPVLSQQLTENLIDYHERFCKLDFSFVANDLGGAHLIRSFGSPIILGRFFNKTMNKYPDPFTYPSGPVMGFDLISSFVSEKKMVLPYSREFISILQRNGYPIVGIDIDKSIFEAFVSDYEKRFEDLAVYVLSPNWAAHGDNCFYMYRHHVCDRLECTIPQKESFAHFTVQNNEVQDFGFTCLPIGQCIYWE